MDRASVSISALTESCISKFDKLLATCPSSLQRIKSLESRLADFNLWADGVGALAKPGASLDARLQGRANDLVLVKNVLVMLADSLDYYAGLVEEKTSHDETNYDEAILNLDSAIKNLALIGMAIRRTGKASRNRRADQTFDPDDYQELRLHLECVILLRPTREGLCYQTENGEYIATLDTSTLSGIQNRLIEANLRRRHNFLVAQKRSRIQKKVQMHSASVIDPSSSNSIVQEESLANIRKAGSAGKQDLTRYPTTKVQEDTAATISGFSLASTAEGTLKFDPTAKKYTPSVTKTQITFIASDVEFPKAPPIPLGREILKCPCCCQSLPTETFQNPKIWKQHIIEDLCPYTCIAENCPTPQLLFCTRDEWESHVKRSHPPRWQCPFCEEQSADYATMESMGCHLQNVHGEELLDNSLETLLSWSAVQTMGIKSCPLCSSCGPEDSPDLVDHVLRHAYDFALRALPWPQPTVHDLNVLPGGFNLPKDLSHAKYLQRWINEAVHESVRLPGMELSDYDRADHSVPVPTDIFEYTDYFLINRYFDDESEDRSSKPQFDQSTASDYSTVSAHQDIMSCIVDSATISPNAQQLASVSGENTIQICNIKTGQVTQRFKGHNSEINSIVFSPNSQQLASASADYHIKIWDTKTATCVQTLMGHNNIVNSIAFSSNNQQLASASDDKTVKIWDIRTALCVQTLKGHISIATSVAFSPDGRQIASASADHYIKIWDSTTGRCRHTLEGHTDAVTSVAFSPNGKQLASASCDHSIKLWDIIISQCAKTLEGHGNTVNSVAFSPSGQQLASASWDCTIRLWDIATGVCVVQFEGHKSKVNLIAFSPGSKELLSISDDNTIRLWDIAAGAYVRTLMERGQQGGWMKEPPSRFTPSDYTIGWICTLRKEQKAALYMLEDRHEDFLNLESENIWYTLGNISGHNVVIACPLLPYSAAKTAAQMISEFPNIKVCLIIGIGSGIPPTVRLGDVVVSCAKNGDPAVLQGTMVNAEKDGQFKRTGSLSNPPTALLTAMTKLEANPAESHGKVLTYVNHIKTRDGVPRNFIKSHLHQDLLFKPGYSHVSSTPDPDGEDDREGEEDDCRYCDKSMIVYRAPREENIMIHYGLIASGNQVIRDANIREKFKEFNRNILCVETKAEGLTDDFPCVVILGICDYADSHKTERWEEYAASTAAAYAKALLTVLPVNDVVKMHAIEDEYSPARIYREFHPSTRDDKNKQSIITPQTKADTTKGRPEIRDIYIAVMGGPGAGKSALISMCAGKDVKPLHDPKSDITKVEDTAFMLNERVRVHLIDTPGFGHVLRSDVDIIQDIALWFSKSFEQGIRMSGVVFLHPINGAHMTRSQHHNILMFQKLCGEKAYPSVVLATTMWSFIDTTIAIQRERELIETDALWGFMHKKGSHIYRFAQTHESGLDIIRHILSFNSTIMLQLQDEIINKGCQIKDTQVGIQLNEYIIHEHAKFEAELRFTEERIQEAVAIKDFEMPWMLGEGCNKLKEMIRFIKEEQTKLRQDLDVVQERKKRKFDVQLRSLDALFSLGQKNILNQGHDGREMIQGQAKNDEAHIDGDDMMLHDAIRNRETDVIKFLLGNGASVEAKGEDGSTPLHLTVWYKQVDIAKLLLKQGANIEAKDNDGDTPLHLAALKGDEDMAELLLIKGADIEAKNNISGSTPLHRAAWNAQVYMVQLLLNQGANVEATDNDGDRPLHFAVQKREADITRLLLHQGANIEAKDSYGETPLHITASEGDVDLARLLLDQGADVNANNKGYRTPLQLAAESGHVDMARLLLDRGASINAWDENGNTALSLALREGRQDIVKLLRERGATF